ncbi:MAG: sensor domain-containing diguanylate cyclase [Candidatus Eisenbacteria bacterium]|nr:sensor domain-containing diguanylate cyclase [Candidatus Eisenbacteria bacterium]
MERDRFFRDVFDSLHDGACLIGSDRRIAYWNRSAEELTGYSSEEVVGRPCDDGVLSHLSRDGSKRDGNFCAMAETLEDGRPREAHVYIAHKDGRRVPVSVRIVPVRDESGGIKGALQVFSQNSELMAARSRVAELEELSAVDPLTHLPSRRCIEQELSSRTDELMRFGRTFGVISLSIDRMSEIRSAFGKEAADDVTRMVGNTLLYNCRPFDVVGRWGGSQFLGTIVGVEKGGLIKAADRLRTLVARSVLPVGEQKLRVTVSVGAAMAEWGDSTRTLIERAERMMRTSRRKGRDKVSVWE